MDETVLEDEVPNIEKIKLMIYVPDIGAYYGVGKYLGKAFSVGREI